MALTERMIGAEVVVHGEVIYDAISVRNGLVPFPWTDRSGIAHPD